MKPKTIALLVVIGLFVIILVQNMSQVEIRVLLWSINMPKLILILASVFLGLIVGWFGHIAFRARKEEPKSYKAVPPKVKPKEEAKGEAKPETQP